MKRSPAGAEVLGLHLYRDPVAHLRSVPFCFAAGAQWVARRGDGIEIRLPYGRAVGNPASGAIDERAVMAVLDHVSGATVYALLQDDPRPTATLDLRVAFQRPPPPGADIIFTSGPACMTDNVAFIAGRARTADGLEVATSSGAFIVGAHPGGATPDKGTDLWQPARPFDTRDASRCASFDEFLGIVRHGQHVRMEFHDRLIGAVSLPALHGGTVAALLATAAGDLAAQAGASRMVAISIQYLRAGRAEATSASAEVERRGARSGVINAVARQAHGARIVARAQATFIAGA